MGGAAGGTNPKRVGSGWWVGMVGPGGGGDSGMRRRWWGGGMRRGGGDGSGVRYGGISRSVLWVGPDSRGEHPRVRVFPECEEPPWSDRSAPVTGSGPSFPRRGRVVAGRRPTARPAPATDRPRSPAGRARYKALLATFGPRRTARGYIFEERVCTTDSRGSAGRARMGTRTGRSGGGERVGNRIRGEQGAGLDGRGGATTRASRRSRWCSARSRPWRRRCRSSTSR